MKTLHESIYNKGIITKIIKYKDKIFKLMYECTNGTLSLIVLIMDGDGVFQYVFTKYDLGDKFEFKASYVSDISLKQRDALSGFKLMEELIKKVY